MKIVSTNRSKSIDVCRGLLFLLMINTHALTMASVSKGHWLFSDFWLPNGWATVAFVVLSGYGVGYIFSVRERAEQKISLINRSKKILAVMFVSNFLFSALQQLLIEKQGAILLNPGWWLGFFTLKTNWTISGVLLPTGLVLLCGLFMIRFCQQAPWTSLVVLVDLLVVIALLKSSLAVANCANTWILQFLLFKGFGFPVLPFVVNGCFGIWLGIFSRSNGRIALIVVLVILMIVQVLIYFTGFISNPASWSTLILSLGAIGKFAWVFMAALLLLRLKSFMISSAIGLIGKFSLGSFIMHRIFLNAIDLTWKHFCGNGLSPGYYYCLLISGALVLTWYCCIIRERFPYINRYFTRLAL